MTPRDLDAERRADYAAMYGPKPAIYVSADTDPWHVPAEIRQIGPVFIHPELRRGDIVVATDTRDQLTPILPLLQP